MALADAVQGATRPSQSITWQKQGGGVEDLSGATVTGLLQAIGSSTAIAIAGAFEIVDGPAGIFRWDYDADDVSVAGSYLVQFSASFGSGQTPAKTFVSPWVVRESLAI